MLPKLSLLLIVVAFLNLSFLTTSQCVHDHFAHKVKHHYYNDLEDQRILTQAVDGKIRIFADYSQVNQGGPLYTNTIKRIVNITASFFYNTLNVTRIQRLYFPKDIGNFCGQLNVSQTYIDNGIIGDIGVIVGSQNKTEAVYVAKASTCALLKSNNRPIWGMMMFNVGHIKTDQVNFQQHLFVGIHEMTHILGFSAQLYKLYPKGNPLIQEPNEDKYLTSDLLKRQAQNHFGCDSAKGMLLQDQDGTLIASHWQRKVVGNQFMIASSKVGSYISRFTLALLQSTGWYKSVNYTYAQPTTWGKDKGCSFFDINNCDSMQFCTGSNFNCDWEGNTIGRCQTDLYAGSCNSIKYFTNTMCIDQNYQLKNLNVKLLAKQRGGNNAKCFISDFRGIGLIPTRMNNRCYINICSATGKYLFVLVGDAVLVCRVPGQKISAPVGLQGTLTCPPSFNNYCLTKTNCPYHCNKNGACINGSCLCTGSTTLTPSCLDVSIYDAPVGSTGGFLQSIADDSSTLLLDSNGTFTSTNTKIVKPVIVKYSANKKCMTGSVFDNVFGECLQCKEVFNCINCDESGCYKCDNGAAPVAGVCK